MQEAIYAETPMVVYPSSGDQPTNAKRLLNNGVAVHMWKFSYESIVQSLNEVFEPQTYESMKKRLHEMNQTMVLLGGHAESAKIVERTAAGTLLPKKYPEHKMISITSTLYLETFKLFVLVIFGLAATLRCFSLVYRTIKRAITGDKKQHKTE